MSLRFSSNKATRRLFLQVAPSSLGGLSCQLFLECLSFLFLLLHREIRGSLWVPAEVDRTVRTSFGHSLGSRGALLFRRVCPRPPCRPAARVSRRLLGLQVCLAPRGNLWGPEITQSVQKCETEFLCCTNREQNNLKMKISLDRSNLSVVLVLNQNNVK